MSKRWLDRSWVETRLFRALDLGHLAIVHDDLDDPETEALDFFTDQGEPLGFDRRN
jgi:hypothetical protein